MTIEQRLRITTITAGVLGLAAIVSWVALFLRPAVKKATPIESPILASGGSMTFRAYSPWVCSLPLGGANVSTDCAALANVTSFSSVGVEQPMSATEAPQNYVGNGTVVFHTRDQAGHLPNSTVSIRLCMSQSSAPGGPCATSNITAVQLHVTNPSGSSAGLVGSNAVEPPDANTRQTYAVQYFDPACPVHGTSAYLIPPNNIPACEHPGHVDWPDGGPYRCRSGACWVFLQ